MKIGVIGKGNIGQAVGKAWSDAGHEIMYGVRDPNAVSEGELPGSVGTVAEAAAFGDAVLFAIPGKVMLDTVKALNLDGKIIIDATNFGNPDDKPLVQALAEALPQSHVYKAFNTLGFDVFQQPTFGDEQADMLFIGPEDELETMTNLIRDVKVNPIYVGGLDQSAILDSALSLWFGLSRRFGRHLAFRVLHDNN